MYIYIYLLTYLHTHTHIYIYYIYIYTYIYTHIERQQHLGLVADGGARGGLCVERFDGGGVLLGGEGALELERRRELAALLRKVARKQQRLLHLHVEYAERGNEK